MSKERKMLLRAFGAEFDFDFLRSEGMAGAIAKALSLGGRCIPILISCRGQFDNEAKPANPPRNDRRRNLARILTVKSIFFVAGVGTGGTVTGVGEVLKKIQTRSQSRCRRARSFSRC